MQKEHLSGAPLVFSEGVVGEAVLAEMQRRSVRLLRSFPDEIAYAYPYYLYQRML
jgi:hypothetical protein